MFFMIRIVLECLQFVFELVLRFVQWLTELWNLKVSRNLRSSPCDAMFETGWIGHIGLHSVGRQAESAWLTQIFCWKNPLEFGKSVIWAWYVANSPFILISKESLCHRKYYLLRSFIPLVYAHENLPHKHSMRC